MKFLDKAFNKFITWFDPEEEMDRSIARTADSIRRFHESLEPEHQAAAPPRRIKPAREYRGLGTWEARPDPFNPEVTVEVYVPALEEMSQQELGRVVSERVEVAFEDKEPTVETERVRHAVHRIAAFYHGSHHPKYGYFRHYDDLVDDVPSVVEACDTLVEFMEQEIMNRVDVVDDSDLSELLRASRYLITMANRTYVSVIAHESLDHPQKNWKLAQPSVTCWVGLADLAGKEAA